MNLDKEYENLTSDIKKYNLYDSLFNIFLTIAYFTMVGAFPFIISIYIRVNFLYLWLALSPTLMIVTMILYFKRKYYVVDEFFLAFWQLYSVHKELEKYKNLKHIRFLKAAKKELNLFLRLNRRLIKKLERTSPLTRSKNIYESYKQLYSSLHDKVLPLLSEEIIESENLKNIMIGLKYVATSFYEQKNEIDEHSAFKILKVSSKPEQGKLDTLSNLLKSLWDHPNWFLKFIVTFVTISILSFLIMIFITRILQNVFPLLANEQLIVYLFEASLAAGALASARRI